MLTIDLNADLGESYGSWTVADDAAMLDVVTSANIACGFHAGDPLTIRKTVRAAAERRVSIGAHVAYPDLVGFGRREMEVAPDELEADVLYQLAALDGICKAEGTRVRYVKPHGALYHRANKDASQAGAIVRAIRAFDASLPLLGALGPLAEAARNGGVAVLREGFADRAYLPDGSLVPRGQPGAVFHDTTEVVRQALSLANANAAESLCLHGDTPESLAHAKAVRTALTDAGFVLTPFVA